MSTYSNNIHLEFINVGRSIHVFFWDSVNVDGSGHHSKVLESMGIHVLIRDSVNVDWSLPGLKVHECPGHVESERESSSGSLGKSVLSDGSISNASVHVPV